MITIYQEISFQNRSLLLEAPTSCHDSCRCRPGQAALCQFPKPCTSRSVFFFFFFFKFHLLPLLLLLWLLLLVFLLFLFRPVLLPVAAATTLHASPGSSRTLREIEGCTGGLLLLLSICLQLFFIFLLQ